MDNQAVRKPVPYKLRPTREQAAMMEQPLRLCRGLSNGAVEQRRTWWGRGQGRVATRAQQEAALPELKGAFPEYATVPSPVVHDVLTRLERPYPAFFRRVQ